MYYCDILLLPHPTKLYERTVSHDFFACLSSQIYLDVENSDVIRDTLIQVPPSSEFQVPSSKFQVPSSAKFQVPPSSAKFHQVPSSKFRVPSSAKFRVPSSAYFKFQVPSLLLLYWILFNSTQLLPSFTEYILGSHSLLAMGSQCQFCLSLDYSIWMLILVCLLH